MLACSFLGAIIASMKPLLVVPDWLGFSVCSKCLTANIHMTARINN